MKQNLKSNSGEGVGLLGRFAAEKKKTVIAVCLMAVMVFMWVRVLGRKGPQSVSASEAAGVTEDQMNPELKVVFIELPKVDGRNDVLTRDFFAVGSWWDFVVSGEGNSSGVEEVSIVLRNGDEKTIRLIAERLKLEAIAMGENPLAIINDTRMSAGDKLLVRNGTNIYECKVMKIEENKVLIRCGEAEITLRLTQTPVPDY